LSEVTIKNLLKDMGLTETESSIYLLLSKRGTSKGTEIAKQVGKDKAQIYHILKSLQVKGLVESTLESPVRFSPVSFEQVLELAVKTKQQEASRIQSSKQELLEYWKTINRGRIEFPVEKFVVIEGRQKIYSKISQMLSQTNEQFSIMSSLSGLFRAMQFGVYDDAFKNKKHSIKYRFITEISKENLAQTKKLITIFPAKNFVFRARNQNFNLNLFHKLIVKDSEETLFFITSQNKSLSEESDELCIWTNCKDIVKILLGIFDENWQNAIDVKDKIIEIESNKKFSNTLIINDNTIGNKMFLDVLSSARDEVKAIISLNRIFYFSNNRKILEKWANKKVSVRILTPVTGINQKLFGQLPLNFEVRHIPLGFMETVLIDGASLFEFNTANNQNIDETNADTFFTTDSSYIQKTQQMFDYLWDTAQSPSKISLETVSEMSMSANKDFLTGALPRVMQKMDRIQLNTNKDNKKLSEKDLIKKMITPEYPDELCFDKVKSYGTLAQAIVHPPKNFKLPDLLFHIYHLGKQSTYGAEDVLFIHPWLETPMGYAYVVSAVLTDNSKTVGIWKKICANSPAENKVTLVGPDELEVRVHGDTFFVGWTKSIVVNSQLTIPPSCLMIEGYGKLKVDSYSVYLPSGYTLRTEGTHSEAFVTYLHPLSKYQGPGSDGAIGKDVILEFIS
jgi:sugar-specific transcriptional regulator TrmB